MIIIIDASVAEELMDDNISSSIENLASARAEGLHFITADIEFIEAALTIELSLRGRKVFLFMRNKYAQEITWSESAPFLFRVVGPRYCTPRRENERLVGINFLSSLNSVLSTQLLCEDETDAFIITKMVEKYIENNSEFGFSKIRFEYKHGGGSRLSRNFDSLVSMERFLLTVVDSDRRFPCDRNRNCAKKMEEKKDSFPVHADLVILGCHEVENLIPVRHLYELYSAENIFLTFIESLLNLDKYKFSINYIDFKRGIKSHLESDNPAEKKFWETIIRNSGLNLDDCKNVIGLGEDVADKYRNFIHDDLQYKADDFSCVFKIAAPKIAYFGAASMELSA